jgi:hypothetical protein
MGECTEDCDRTVPEMYRAIGAALFEEPRDLEIHLLRTRGRTSYFRVNWWSVERVRGPRIRRSAFLRVERAPGGYRVLPERPLAA